MSGIQDWEDRIAIVTGGASGIGRGIATAFIAEGATVVIADIDRGALESTAAEIGAIPVQTDVADAASVHALATSATQRFGTVDILVNNAGVGPKAEVADLTLRDWKWILDVNLWGVIHGIDAFLPTLKANPRGGWIVNTASMSTFFFPPGYAPYVASKAAVDGLSRVLRSELAAAGVRVGVTVLHPGAVRTNISASLRTRPEDLVDDSGLFDFDIAQKLPDDARWATPGEAGALVVRAVSHGDPFAFTHPEMLVDVERSFAAVRDGLLAYAEGPRP
jgi:NAD(P)-dependent dehydrogenase (short-subunit alcohol dehydrogenase family)